LDGVAKSGNNISEFEANGLGCHVPVYKGVLFMGTLANEIRNIIRDNEIGEAKKCLKYIELYVRMAILKDAILQQMAALIPDSHKNLRKGVCEVQNSLRKSANKLFKFLYESEIGNNVIPYFDPDKYDLTDAYMSEVLKIESYDRSMAGRYFLNVRLKDSYGRLGYEKNAPLVAHVDQGVHLLSGGNYYWKLVPHGKNLFSIVNRHNCPDDDLCDALLTWTGSGGEHFVTIEHNDPALCELTRQTDGRYRYPIIVNKREDKIFGGSYFLPSANFAMIPPQ